MTMTSREALCRALAVLAIAAGLAGAQQPPGAISRESLNDAWFTGPILAPSAATRVGISFWSRIFTM
jgi:hypothetical protein